jgi:hypothetical protein
VQVNQSNRSRRAIRHYFAHFPLGNQQVPCAIRAIFETPTHWRGCPARRSQRREHFNINPLRDLRVLCVSDGIAIELLEMLGGSIARVLI